MSADVPSREASGHDLPETVARLLDDHKRFRRLFDVVERSLQGHSLHEPALLDLLACLADYIVEYPERIHHPREDLITEVLVDKGLTPGERALVELAVSQHAELAARTTRISRDVDRMLARKAEADESFTADYRDYLALQLEHMRREEQQLFPLAVRLLSAEDWEQIERSDAKTADPISEARLDRYRSLYELINASADKQPDVFG